MGVICGSMQLVLVAGSRMGSQQRGWTRLAHSTTYLGADRMLVGGAGSSSLRSSSIDDRCRCGECEAAVVQVGAHISYSLEFCSLASNARNSRCDKLAAHSSGSAACTSDLSISDTVNDALLGYGGDIFGNEAAQQGDSQDAGRTLDQWDWLLRL